MPRISFSALETKLLQTKRVPDRRTSSCCCRDLKVFAVKSRREQNTSASEERTHTCDTEQIVPGLQGNWRWRELGVIHAPGTWPPGTPLCLGHENGWGSSPSVVQSPIAMGSGTSASAIVGFLLKLLLHFHSVCSPQSLALMNHITQKGFCSPSLPLLTLGCRNCLLSLLSNLALPHEGNRIKWNASFPISISLPFSSSHWNSAVLSRPD